MNDIKKITQEAAEEIAKAMFGNDFDAGILDAPANEIIPIIESACEKARSIGHDAGFKMGRSVTVLPDVIAFKGKP